MLETLNEQATVLAVGTDLPQHDEALSISYASTLRSTVEMMRMMRFDLLVIGENVDGCNNLDLVRRVRNVWPSQKWALVSPQLDAEEEILARSLGVTCIFEDTPDENMLTEVAMNASHRSRRLEVSHA